jgi:cyclophilin family peptidyl-prolyl cis-trans isomerase
MENRLRGSGLMMLKRLFLFSAAAVVPMGAAAADPQIDVKTTAGDFRIELYPAKAPKTVENFLQYVKSGHYNGTIFHRVIDGFMIQGGGFDKSFKQKPTKPPVPIESKNGLKNDVGWLAMARTNDPNSATAQFFINVNNNGFLNYPGQDGHGYTVFGKVVSGDDVVRKIGKTQTGPGGPFPTDVPRQAIVIESMTLVGAK